MRSTLGLAAVLAAGLAIAPATAASADDRAPSEPTPENVRRFFDDLVPELLAEQGVPGAAVSVVAGGEQVFASGYGEADSAAGTPVVAEETVFPTASVSKSFTALAALQLVEEGELDLHTDVNEYLPEQARIDDTHPGRPVTLHHLLTHTAGFEETVGGMLTENEEDALSLSEYVARYEPERIYRPGEFIAYSNYGTTLVGLLIEEVSGMSFEDYTDTRVFAPLGMDSSSFRHPDESDGLEFAVTHHALDTPAPVVYLNQGPAGSLHSPVTDMSRFMLALLNDGELDGTRVLSPEGTAMMLERQETTHPALPGSGYGVWEGGGEPRRVGHGGDYVGAHSRYALVPELGLGVYAVVNGDSSDTVSYFDDVRNRMVQEFLDEFAGDAAPEPATAADIPLERYAGTYVGTRISHNGPSAAVAPTNQLTVSVTADGTLSATTPLGEQTWTPVAPGVFRSEDGETLAFSESEDGEIVGAGVSFMPEQSYARVPWHGAPSLHFGLAGVALLVMATMLVWPVTALVRRLRRRGATAPVGARLARLAAGVAGLLAAGFVGFAVVLLSDESLLETLMFSDSLLLTLPLTLMSAVVVGLVAVAVTAWVRSWWSLAGRVHYTLVVWAAAVFVSVGANYGLTVVPL